MATVRLSCLAYKHFEARPSIPIISMYGNVPLRCVVSVKATLLTWHLDVKTSDTIFWFQEAYFESVVRWSCDHWTCKNRAVDRVVELTSDNMIWYFRPKMDQEVYRRWCQVVAPPVTTEVAKEAPWTWVFELNTQRRSRYHLDFR